MDALGKSLAIVMAVAAVICIVPVISDTADAAGEMDGLMLYEVNPFDNEGVSVFNYGDEPIDLTEYIIADNPNPTKSEGYIEFTESLIVEPGTFVVIATSSGEPNSFIGREDIERYYVGTNGIQDQKSFGLNNSGDDVYLFHGDDIVDAVCYGNVLIEDSKLWADDEPFSDKTNNFFQRHGTVDTDTSADWHNYGATYYEFDPDYKIDATVTAFLFPDDGGIPVYDAVSEAEESLYINVYLLISKNFIGMVHDMMEANPDLEVNILIEGTPVDGSVAPYAPALLSLVELGADVRMIGMGDAARFIQDHAKYAIIDMDTVVVTSENWTDANLNGSKDENVYVGSEDGNRGWGAVIESSEYASFMYEVFRNDFSLEYGDVVKLEDRFDISNASTPYYDGHDSLTLKSYEAQVTPILSNDNSYEFTEYFLGFAEERLYAEQQSLTKAYQDWDNEESPLYIMGQRANAGVDTRLIISTSVDGYGSVVQDINLSSQIQAAVLNTPYVHNKGIVSDDVAVVSSVNWTDESFNSNRECAVAIYSKDVADYFAQAFLNDFNQCYDYDGFRVDITEIQATYPADQEVTFTVTVLPAGNYQYIWDIGDGSEPIDSKDVPRIVCKPAYDGEDVEYTLTVTVVDMDTRQEITVTKEYMVTAEESGDSGSFGDIGELISDNLYIFAPLIVIILGAIAAVSRSGSKKRSTKKRK